MTSDREQNRVRPTSMTFRSLTDTFCVFDSTTPVNRLPNSLESQPEHASQREVLELTLAEFHRAIVRQSLVRQ